MIVELLFAERNHVCAICVVNGYCELQKLGYAVGMDHVRFAYQTPALQIDASHQRFALDNNRCVLCTRCVRVCDEVEGAHTWDVKGRGATGPGHHRPQRALGRVAELHELRQVRPGLPHRGALREDPAPGRDGQEPRLPRLPEDRAGEEAMDPVTSPPRVGSPGSPPPGSAAARAATCRSSTWTSGSSTWRRSIDLVYSPIMDVKEFPEDVDVTLVEGAVANEEHLHQIRLIRERTKLLVSFGDCAVTGNVTAMRNPLRRAEAVLKRAYIENVDHEPAASRRARHRPGAARPRAAHPRGGAGGRLPPGLPALGGPHPLRAHRARGRPDPGPQGPPQVRLEGTDAMGQRIVIDPVTRIEGHAKITLLLDDQGEVSRRPVPRHRVPRLREVLRGPLLPRDARHHVAHLRHLPGEPHARLGQGRRRAPRRRDPARRAMRLRRLMNFGQIVQSHALSLLPPLLARLPARLRLRPREAQRDRASSRRTPTSPAAASACASSARRSSRSWPASASTRPGWCPGGVDEPLTAAGRDRIQAGCPRRWRRSSTTLDVLSARWTATRTRRASSATSPRLFMGLVTPDGGLEHYDGKIRIVDATGTIVADQLPTTSATTSYIGEAVEPWTYLKFPYYKPLGYPGGMYRVGPLARLNVASHCGTPARRPRARRVPAARPRRGARPPSTTTTPGSSRSCFCVERIEEILDDPDILTPHVLAHARRNRYEGVGVQRGAARHALPPLQGRRRAGSSAGST